ncbi:hypothetical protein BU24DRAFT_424637 [Aaosphaeria arxii CBS 175.79]|uniref:Presequence translocated-associated motor subunit PAM17 n=1 Tax=Aaosphaeria arxii CBS 175.79 TaxID=1450172 RepID=A0A6A5XK28_9PLEO|nr:uncharacterized protein BU24DRAFT_424637 [Aaosphaeria arxii CBS 175.79]KAF2013638.1 hypothetical protein BU24DRAFT_424637 [Aaosphaeria arxii CBS 175.79]
MLSSSGLLPARTFAVAFKPAIIAPCTASFTSCARPASFKQQQIAQHPAISSSIRRSPTTLSIRQASTTAPASSTTSQPSSTSGTLTWNRFLELRRTRRKISVVASSVSALATTYFGLQQFIQGGYDSILSAQLGIDPILTAGFTSIGLLAVGWLIGPFFGGAVFNMRYASLRGDIVNVSLDDSSRRASFHHDPGPTSTNRYLP